ncbi:MAG: response regulator [Elusimicrobia bacterium]|jgi:CheY-like chemotaxis protein|nr:response regulator [Elusimicrobiota bacterium]
MSKPIKFLLIEDNMTDIKITELIFKKAKINNSLSVVKTGEEALKYLKNQDQYINDEQYPAPDVILMDIKMPGIDGFDTTEHIRKLDNYKNIPIIILTTSVRPDDVNKSFEIGANDYIPKPITVENLMSSLSKLGFTMTIFKRGETA